VQGARRCYRPILRIEGADDVAFRYASMTPDALRDLLQRDPLRAAPTVQALAERGVLEAQLLYGRMLLEGNGVIKSHAAAFVWFQRAAARHDAAAINMLGRCLENGWGADVDAMAAFACYLRAAELGDAWAQYNVGHMYLDGNGVARDDALAMLWYTRAAHQGHARAMNLVGRCFEEGWGAPKDAALAAQWYRRSAEAGYFRGQYNWATVLTAASCLDEAASWLARAKQGATPETMRAIADFAAAVDHPAMQALAVT
jgi:TPR repeat protein